MGTAGLLSPVPLKKKTIARKLQYFYGHKNFRQALQELLTNFSQTTFNLFTNFLRTSYTFFCPGWGANPESFGNCH
jgi:hypothetical protein